LIVETPSRFFLQVYELVRLVPPGRVTSYGAIAKYLGNTRGARMVGWALNASSGLTDFVPAHRVVNRKGLLTGKAHFQGSDVMISLLEAEGVIVTNNQIQHFEQIFWDPFKELE